MSIVRKCGNEDLGKDKFLKSIVTDSASSRIALPKSILFDIAKGYILKSTLSVGATSMEIMLMQKVVISKNRKRYQVLKRLAESGNSMASKTSIS